MTYRDRERVRKILAHEEADRVPYCARGGGATRDVVERLDLGPDHLEMCLEGDFAFVLIEPEVDVSRFTPFFDGLPDNVQFTYWGIGRQPQKTAEGWHAGHRMFHPLARIDTVAGLRSYPFPDVINSGADQGLEHRIEALKSRGYTVLGQMSQTILETAYCLRGLPRLMIDFYERPEYVEFLFETIAEQRRFQARRFAEAGADILRIGDDIATQESLLVSPELYRDWIKPLHGSVIAAARAVQPGIPVKYHSDGRLTPLLPHLLEIGVTIINPVQPECMDLKGIKREYGMDLTLWGCMPVQSIFAHGGRDDVRAYVEFLMQHIAVDGGLVLKFTNFLQTDRSLENLATFLELFWELGRYG